MNRAHPIPYRGARVLPIGDVQFGALCDPGVPCRPLRLEVRPEGTFVHAVTVPDGYLVRVHAEQLAVMRPRLRSRSSAAA